MPRPGPNPLGGTREAAALDRAFRRLLAAGMAEDEARDALAAAIRCWLDGCARAQDAELERRLAWR